MDKEDQKTFRGFVGTIEYIRLVDLVQVSCLAQMSAVVQVQSGLDLGRIYVRSGQVVHAETADVQGEEAFYEMLAWDKGNFDTLAVPEDIPISINRTWEHLLIESIRRHRNKVIETSDGDESASRGPSRGFLGTISGIGLTDLVQLICMDGTNRVVEVQPENLTGKIFIRGGQVCHAEAGDLRGEEAFFELLKASRGRFDTHAAVEEGMTTIEKPWEYLLIEAMRFQDEQSGIEESEETEKKVESLLQRVQKKNVAGKVRLAMTGDKEVRNILIRDSNRMVQVAIISNPRITDGEVASIANSRQVDEEVLRRIAASREWSRLYPVRLALATNPKTPLAIATKIVPTLNRQDLKNISRSKTVPNVVAQEARRRLPTKE